MANAKLDELKKRRDELKRQVKHASDNRDKQKKSDRRRKRKKENSFAQLIPVFIAVLVVLIWCTMQDVLWGGTIELAAVSQDQPNSAQSRFVAQYLSAKGAETVKEDERKEVLHSGEALEVATSSSNGVNVWMTYFNAIAYHYDELAELLEANFPEWKRREIADDEDLELFVTAFLCVSRNETAGYSDEFGTDVPQGPRSYSREWAGYTLDQKRQALLKRSPCYSNSHWGTSYGEGFAHDGTQAWGYGICQFTFGRRYNLVVVCDGCDVDFTTPYGQALYTVFELGCSTNKVHTNKYGASTLGGYGGRSCLGAAMKATANYPSAMYNHDLNAVRDMTDIIFVNSISGFAEHTNHASCGNTARRNNVDLAFQHYSTIAEMCFTFAEGGSNALT